MNSLVGGLRKFLLVIIGGLSVMLASPSLADENWTAALAQMPLGTNVTELNRTNVAEIVLTAFQSNQTVKALVMMPGATDEFYFFRRASVKLAASDNTLLDIVRAMTNQTHIIATFRAPLLLLHTSEDPLEPLIEVLDASLAAKLKARPFVSYFSYNDRDWDYLHPILTKNISGRWLGFPEFLPPLKSPDSWHFFRHTLAGWNLTQWEALEAISLAGKTTMKITKTKITFAGDVREGSAAATPKP